MASGEITDWINENMKQGILWYVKRLSGNDTLANKSHQAGPYVPKELIFELFPELNRPDVRNPDATFNLRLDPFGDERRVRVVWYNIRMQGTGTRNEARFTNFGGASSALLDPENTGALAVFAFHRDSANVVSLCRVWVCRNELEAEVIEDRIGPVEPAVPVIWRPLGMVSSESKRARAGCVLTAEEIPREWMRRFPTCEQIIRKAIEMQSSREPNVDRRLIKRRNCEFEIFRSVEEATALPTIKKGFQGIEDFLACAQSIIQRRKTRSGSSLEGHVQAILSEEHMKSGVDFDSQGESEPGKKPDFLFPNVAAYKDKRFPVERLRMLATKTTCKDRWRQILYEADRIPKKHLLTLQEGISQNQFKEMRDAGVQLIIPKPLFRSFHSDIRRHLRTFESFIAEVRELQRQ